MTDSEDKLLERISTGVPGLDEVLEGGIPVQSITVIAGDPGTGKTVMSLQLVFAAARQGKKCMVFPTMSEPSFKILRYMQLFDFFDPELMEDRIVFTDLGSHLISDGPEAALSFLIERVEIEQPDIVVIDSFKAIHDMAKGASPRTYVYDLAVSMAAWGATTILVGEYTSSELMTLPEFAVADGIFRLGEARQELATVRDFEVHKLRGSSFTSGVHFFDIDSGGIQFYPRVRGPELIAMQPDLDDRVTTGAAGLDALLRGGFPKGSTTLAIGGTGTGKSLLALTFLAEGASRGDPGVLLALEETPNQIRSTARAIGWDLEEFERRGLLTILYCSPIEISTDRFLRQARQVVADIGAKRVVLDSLTSLALGAVSSHRFKEVVYALTKHLRAVGATSMMAIEVAELLGTGQISGHGISFAADNVIFMRYTESQGRLERALAVVKARGIEHGTELVRFAISDRGLEVGGQVDDLQGVLTGAPVLRHPSRDE